MHKSKTSSHSLIGTISGFPSTSTNYSQSLECLLVNKWYTNYHFQYQTYDKHDMMRERVIRALCDIILMWGSKKLWWKDAMIVSHDWVVSWYDEFYATKKELRSGAHDEHKWFYYYQARNWAHKWDWHWPSHVPNASSALLISLP